MALAVVAYARMSSHEMLTNAVKDGSCMLVRWFDGEWVSGVLSLGCVLVV